MKIFGKKGGERKNLNNAKLFLFVLEKWHGQIEK